MKLINKNYKQLQKKSKKKKNRNNKQKYCRDAYFRSNIVIG